MTKFEGIPPEEGRESIKGSFELLPGLLFARQAIADFAVEKGLQLQLKGLPSSREYNYAEQESAALAEAQADEKVSEAVKEIAGLFDSYIEEVGPESAD